MRNRISFAERLRVFVRHSIWLAAGCATMLAMAGVPGTLPALDTSWGNAGMAPAGVENAVRVLLLPDGSSLHVGVTCSRPVSCIEVRKLGVNGGADTSFGASGYLSFSNLLYGSNYAIDAFLSDANQNVLVVGGAGRNLFALKFSATTGAPVATFGSGGVARLAFGGQDEYSTPLAVALSSDSSTVFVSAYSTRDAGDVASRFIAKFSASTGLIDSSFGTNGSILTLDNIYALSTSPSSQTLLAGGSTGNSAALFRFETSSGELDPTFGNSGISSFQLGPTVGTGRSDRVVSIHEIPNTSKVVVATVTTYPLGVTGISSNTVKITVFDTALGTVSTQFTAGFTELPAFNTYGFDFAAPHPRLIVNAETARIYSSARLDGISHYASMNFDGTPDIEFGDNGNIDSLTLSQMVSSNLAPFPMDAIAIHADKMMVAGSRPLRLRLSTCDFDIDGDGLLLATRDGISALLAMRGVPLTTAKSGASRATPKLQEAYARLLIGSGVLDLDGDGTVSAETDGVIMIRWLLGIRGSAVTNGLTITPTATRRTAADIENYLHVACAIP